MTNELVLAAVVTGASGGIGEAIATTLAKDGYYVFVAYANGKEKAEQVVAKIEENGGKARSCQINVADSESVTTFFKEEIKDKFRLDVLVNNAGITNDGLMLRMKDEDFDKVININLKGAFICTREAFKIMSKQRFGRIINIVSVVGQMGNAGQANYAAAKAGLIGITKSAAKEFGSRNVTVNAVAPGFIETSMTAVLADDVKAQYAANIPLGTFGSAQNVADAVAFLASEKAAYITGHVLSVNGGLYC